jgi:hypothetical protein
LTSETKLVRVPTIALGLQGLPHDARRIGRRPGGELDTVQFVGGYIVNVRRIAQLWSIAHGQFAIELRSGQRLQSRRTYSDRIRRALSNPF